MELSVCHAQVARLLALEIDEYPTKISTRTGATMDTDEEDLPGGMSWEEFVFLWNELNTPPLDEEHPPLPEPPIDPDEPPF
jgi:hypothetical protein